MAYNTLTDALNALADLTTTGDALKTQFKGVSFE